MKTNKPLSGKQVYLRHSFPCAEGRCLRGEITEDDLEKLKQLVASNEEPDSEFLRHCFPLSFGPFEARYLNDSRGMWNPEVVREFWVTCHGRNGDEKLNSCRVEEAAVVKAIVRELKGKGTLVSVMYPGAHDTFFALNIYDIVLTDGDTVRLHQKVVIEKVS